MIDARIVFKNSNGKVVPKETINSWLHHEFFQKWAEAEIRRDIEVTLTDEEAVNKGLKNPGSLDFQLVGVAAWEAWQRLHEKLSLTSRMLAHWHDPSEGTVAELKVRKAHSPIIAPELDEVKQDDFSTSYYTTYYWLDTSFVRTTQWYQERDPKEVVYDIVLELLKQWTMRDNATLLLLLKNATLVNEPKTYETLTPVAFSDMLTQVVQWAIPVPHIAAKAKALVGLSDPDWIRFMAPARRRPVDQTKPPGWNNDSTGVSVGRLMDLEVFCLGSSYDAFHPFPEIDEGKVLCPDLDWPDIYMMGMPSTLGIRAIKISPKGNPVKKVVNGVEEHGWLWNTYIGTAVLNSRAVFTATISS